MRPEVLVERIDLLARQTNSLLQRADAFERVVNEMRTEAAATAHELALIRKQLENDVLRQRVRRAFTGTSILRAHRDRRTA